MNIIRSKQATWFAMILVIVLIIVAVCTRVVSSIWEYTPLFLLFMAVFCHLMAFMLMKMSPSACKKLDLIAFVFAILAIIALITVFILDEVALG